MIQVGVIGYGLSAKVFHIPYVQATPGFALRAIVQRHGDEAQRDHPADTGVVVYRDTAALFADAAVDLVIVTTPPGTHVELAEAALTAGKHVVVEKPFAASSADCDRLIAVAQKAGRTLSVFQNRRWDSDFVTLQQVLAAGTLGHVVEFESHFDRFKAPAPAAAAGQAAWGWKNAVEEPATGAVYDLGSHLIDQALVLFGLPSRVTAFTSRQVAGNTAGPVDAFTLLLHYDDAGLLATLKASAASAENDQLRFWVRGDGGAFRKYHLDPQEDQLRHEGLKLTDAGFGIEAADHAASVTVYTNGDGKLATKTQPTVSPPPTYKQFYALLGRAIESKGAEPVPVPAEEARNCIRVVELALKSAEEGRTVPWAR